MPISQKRLAEIAAIADEDIDTSEIPEADGTWFKGARLVIPQEGRSTAKSTDDTETRRSAGTALASTSQPRSMR